MSVSSQQQPMRIPEDRKERQEPQAVSPDPRLNNALVQSMRSCCQAGMDREKTAKIIARSVAKLPDWVRHDLSSTDKSVRTRAEETLTAILAAALEE
jgi:hypothetical protein